jgi:hypothetical protein
VLLCRAAFSVAALAALAACCLLAVPGDVSARQQSFSITSVNADEWPSVRVNARIVDTTEQPVPGLTAEDFVATVGGEPVPVTDAHAATDAEIGIATVLTFDTSEVMAGDPLEQAKEAGLGLVDQLGPGDQVAVVRFSDTVDEVVGFTADKERAQEAINSLTADGGTALYAAVNRSVQETIVAPLEYKAVVLFSGGPDTAGGDPEQTLARAGESRAVFFVLGFGNVDEDYLGRLAAAGHGQFLLDTDDLSTLYGETAALLRQQYVLTLDASGLDPEAANGQPLDIQVNAAGQVLTTTSAPLAVPEEILNPGAEPAPEPAPAASDEESSSFPVIPLIAAAALAVGGGAAVLMVIRRRRRGAAVSEAVVTAELTADRFSVEPESAVEPSRWEYPSIERAAAETPHAWLVLEDDSRFALGDRPTTVGFTPDCAVRLPSNGVSGFAGDTERARVWRRDGRYMLHNLSRMGGVTIAGRPVTWAVLEDGDEIMMGGIRLIFRENEPPAAAKG